MHLHDELDALERKAIVIAAIPDRKLRQKGGFQLEYQCRALDQEYRILGGLDIQAEITFRAILKIVFDYILYDVLEDEDWTATLPDHFEGDIGKELRDLKTNAP